MTLIKVPPSPIRWVNSAAIVAVVVGGVAVGVAVGGVGLNDSMTGDSPAGRLAKEQKGQAARAAAAAPG